MINRYASKDGGETVMIRIDQGFSEVPAAVYDAAVNELRLHVDIVQAGVDDVSPMARLLTMLLVDSGAFPRQTSSDAPPTVPTL